LGPIIASDFSKHDIARYTLYANHDCNSGYNWRHNHLFCFQVALIIDINHPSPIHICIGFLTIYSETEWFITSSKNLNACHGEILCFCSPPLPMLLCLLPDLVAPLQSKSRFQLPIPAFANSSFERHPLTTSPDSSFPTNRTYLF
jgi:hypothetical protein